MINLVLFLAAIAQVETGGDPLAVGKAGERSAFQLTQLTWSRYTADPFEWATSHPSEAFRVATEHAKWAERMIVHKSGPSAVFKMAHLWNPNAPIDYSQRVERLYLRLQGANSHP